MEEIKNFTGQIPDKKKIEILRKNWMSHDAKSQMTIVREFGWDKGNKINKQVIQEMGKTMMQRLLNTLEIKKITNMTDLLNFCYTAMNLYYPPPSMVYELKKLSETEAIGKITKCQAIEQVKSLNVENFYECGCHSMRAGWYKAMGAKVQEECLTCIKNGDEFCTIRLNVKRFKK